MTSAPPFRGVSVVTKWFKVRFTGPVQRSRPWYALLATAVIGAGLLWRSGLLPLTSFSTKYGGDSLWALVVFLGFGFAFPRASVARTGLSALAFSWCIEFSQIYHAPWIDGIRSTVPGRLVLGASFNSPDLLAYVVGISIGVLGEYCWCRGRPKP